jgi:hypothetical protein
VDATMRFNLFARASRWRSHVLAILTITPMSACLWEVAARHPNSIDGEYQRQDKIDSGGKDAWLCSLPH